MTEELLDWLFVTFQLRDGELCRSFGLSLVRCLVNSLGPLAKRARCLNQLCVLVFVFDRLIDLLAIDSLQLRFVLSLQRNPLTRQAEEWSRAGASDVLYLTAVHYAVPPGKSNCKKKKVLLIENH